MQAHDGVLPGLVAGYRTVAEVGRGGENVVYRVTREADGRDYALKISRLASADGRRGLVAYRREAALLASIAHPDLTYVHEVGMVDGRPYLVMDLVGGRELGQLLTEGPLPVGRAVEVVLQVCGPLAAMHRCGLVHRDVKPQNIMVLPDGHARLIDFGLAVEDTPSAGSMAAGTLAYSPPEQVGLLRRPVDARSDLYSLGVVLFECLTGRLPFESDDVGELLRMHATMPAPDVATWVPDVSPELAGVVARLLAKDPDDRFPACEDLVAHLRQLLMDERGQTVGSTDALFAEAAVVEIVSGRSRELAELTIRWERVRAGDGCVTFLRGSSGVGKSWLAQRVAAVAAADGALVLAGKSSPDDPEPFVPLREGLDGLLATASQRPVEERDRLYERVRRAAGQDVALLQTLSPRLAGLLNAGADPPEVSQDQFASTVTAFLCALSAESGLMMVLDDVQWLDAGTRLVLRGLGQELDGRSVWVLATARDDEQSAPGVDALADALGEAVDTDLTVKPLDRDGVTEMIAQALPRVAVNDRFIDLLESRGGGSPFVVLQYLRAIVDGGLLYPSWGTWILDEAGLDALQLPGDVLGLVLARVRELGEDLRQILVIAAAVGNQFDPLTVAAVYGDEQVILDALEQAARYGLVESRDSGRYAFLHDRIREALLSRLSEAEFRSLHLRIALVLKPAVGASDAADGLVFSAARHFQRAGDLAEPEDIFAACADAGARALATYAPDRAVAFFSHAAGLGVPLDAAFHTLLGTALCQDGQWKASIEHLEQAIAQESDPLERAAVLARVADANRSAWWEKPAYEAIRRALRELDAPLPGGSVRRAVHTLRRYLQAVLVSRTGLGRARNSREVRRCELIAQLHETSSYLAILGLRPLMSMMHNIHMMYWGNRIGHGGQYARGQAAFGAVAEFLGLRRISARAFAIAYHASGDFVTRALIANYRGALTFLRSGDDGEQWVQALREHSRFLDVACICDTAAALRTTALARGDLYRAREWCDLAERRMSLAHTNVNSLIILAPMTYALQGQHAEAARALETVSQLTDLDVASHSAEFGQILARLFVLHEQDEVGEPFDQVAQTLEQLRLLPRLVLRPLRLAYLILAGRRLAQVRAATDPEREVRLRQVRRALRLLSVAADSPELRDRLTIYRADYALLKGDPKAALALLNSRDLVPAVDSPMAAAEAALVRARALTAAGAPAEAVRHAVMAAHIAQEQGWAHRAQRIRAEFALERPDSGGRSLSGRSTASGTFSEGRPSLVDVPALPSALERQRLLALQQVSLASSRVLDPVALARIVLDEMIRIFQADRAFLFLTDGDGRPAPFLGRSAHQQDLPELVGYSVTLVDRVYETGEPLVVAGTDEGEALGAHSVVVHGLRSIMLAPLQIDQRRLGVVNVDSQVAKGIFSTDDIDVLTALATHIATALETARAAQLEISVHAAQRQRDLAEALRAALEVMTDTLDPDLVLARLVDVAPTIIPCQQVILLPKDHPAYQLLTPQPDSEPDDVLQGTDQSLPEGLPDDLAVALRTGPTWAALPLRSRDHLLGALLLVADPADPRLLEELQVIQVLITQAMTVYDNASLFARVNRLAVVDELTGIANRRRFFDLAERHVNSMTGTQQSFAVIMLDIDHFKHINDTYGHPTGDDVLREVAARLASCLRAGDLLGRYGGEEFALLLPGATLSTDVPERLRSVVNAQPAPTRSGPVPVTISIGVAWYQDGDTIASLLARADGALYHAKHEGRNCVRTA
jgi:diguanylate cyclase (GGDEF)-like protein